MNGPLACPFCGSVAVCDRTDGWGNAFHKCKECHAQGPSRKVTLKNPWADVSLWNKRYTPPEFVPAAEMIKLLREKTGAGIVDAKKALRLAKGDMLLAEEWLRRKGTASPLVL